VNPASRERKPCSLIFFVALDSAKYWSVNAASALRTQRVAHHSSAAKAKSGYLFMNRLASSGLSLPGITTRDSAQPDHSGGGCGNGVVCKTSDFTPQCGALIEKLFLDAGFPKDLVTIVQGDGEWARLCSRPLRTKFCLREAWQPGVVSRKCVRKTDSGVLELGGRTR